VKVDAPASAPAVDAKAGIAADQYRVRRKA
jgi:hypothetical protein